MLERNVERKEPAELKDEQVRLRTRGTGAAAAALLVGVAGLAAGFMSGRAAGDSMRYFWFSYLLNYCFFLSLSIGALFFVILSHLARFEWGVAVRRIAEIIAATMPLMAILFIPILANLHTIYSWTSPALLASDQLLRHKHPYLNTGSFYVRAAIYFASWIILSMYFLNRSVKQDRVGGVALTNGMRRFSPLAMTVFALVVTFLSFDLIKSLDYTWHSDAFGVYFFAGCALGGIAIIILTAMLLQNRGPLRGVITVEHYHDLGKMLFGFVFFWAYIAFSQYMLIWYANIPEETAWYLKRQTGSWIAVSLLLLFGHFLIPFLILLIGNFKRNLPILGACALWLLAMHWVDMYYLIMPQSGSPGVPPHFIDVAIFAGLGGLFVACLSLLTDAFPLVPLKDPKLPESLAFKNTP